VPLEGFSRSCRLARELKRIENAHRAIETAVRMADTVSSGASNGTKCPAPGTNRKSRLGNVSSIPSAQDAGFTGSSSPHLLTTVGMLIGPSGAWADGPDSSSYVARYQPKLAFMASGRAKVSTIASNAFGRTLSLLPTQWS
jgi:hypothetical protein